MDLKLIGLHDLKTAIAVSIAAAFGFILALVWKDIITGIFTVAGLTISAPTELRQIPGALIGGLIITFVCVIGIVYITKWGQK